MKKITFLLVMFLVFTSFSGGVRAATWYLQPGPYTWTALAGWNSLPFGGGTNPTSISSADNFDFNSRIGYSPIISSGTATFGGNQLILHGGMAGALVIKTIYPANVVIGNLVSYGGYIQEGDAGTVAVGITTFTNNSNTTLDGHGSSQGLNFTIGTLTGAGDICAIGTNGGAAGGAILMNVTTATGFTGTLHIADGCQFTFENGMTSRGALEVEGSGTTITLNYTVTFKGLTINGTAKAPGTYTAATLGAPFSGTGSVVVQTASTSSSNLTQMFGVNLPGGSFSSGDAFPTDQRELNYYQGKGLNLIRLPFLWERVQPTLGGALSTTELAKIDAAVALAAADGMQVILDMHNYDHYTISGTSYLIGSTQAPYADYQQVWQLLAAHYNSMPGIYGYDIMNEPEGDSGTWDSTTAQYGVNGVRQSDTTHYVFVEGENYSGAQSWMNNGNFSVTDSANKVIYSAHTYWDSNDSGVYSGTYDSNNDYPNVGMDRVAPFIYWLSLKGVKGHVGEFGVPNNVASPDYRWNDALDNFLYYLNSSGVEGTYWSGGECWGTTYALSCATGTPPVDAPAMSVLQTYGGVNVTNGSFVTGQTLGTIRNDYTGYVGFKFTVGSTPVTVSQLGRWVVSGNSGTHTLKVTLASTGSIVPGGSVTVATSGAPAGQYVYANLTAPIILAANTAYYVSSLETSGGDQWYDSNTTLTHTSDAVVNSAISAPNNSTQWTAAGTTNNSFGPASFIYSLGSGGSHGAFVTGQTLGTIRNDYTGYVGFKFTVGSAPITISQLGRWVTSGNSGAHTLKVTLASTGSVVPGGSVSVATSGAPAGQYVYANLTTPIVLLANTAYYVSSLETAAGDQWYDSNTTLTHTSDAVINSAISAPNNSTQWTAAGTTNNSFGPVSFIY